MINQELVASGNNYLTDEVVDAYIKQISEQISRKTKKILIIPPDYTRKASGAGKITAKLANQLSDKEITIMPASGTHAPMTSQEIKKMFGSRLSLEKFVVHRWRKDTAEIGTISADFIQELINEEFTEDIPVRINKRLVEDDYDLIISIGQVVPHEVVGMANYSKNVFVGCGGVDIINYSHYIGAIAGMENYMGKDHSPVRKIYDFAEENFAKNIPLLYILTVSSTEINPETGLTKLKGLFCGRERRTFEKAVQLSQQENIIYLEKPLQKVIVYLEPEKFKSTWLGGKAIYRTRMAIADGGDLIIAAPGLKRFGEDPEIDRLIRKYGYAGVKEVMAKVNKYQELKNNLSAAAHMIHGSSEGRFNISFAAPEMNRKEIEAVNFNFLPYQDLERKYKLTELTEGFNQIKFDGKTEEIFYIDNPATGLWVADRY